MIYLVRHGLDDESYIGGHSNIDLTNVGINQAKETGIWLKENNIEVSKIYTSDIKRAISTSNIIGEILNLEVIKTNKLRELDKGLLTGLKKEIAKNKFPDYINVDKIDIRYPNGESMLDLYRRIKKLLENIDEYDNSLIITHRGVINMIYVLLNNDKLTMDKEKYGVEHASVHELDLEKRKIRRIK